MKTLTDTQNQSDNRKINIQKVGVKDVEIPLIIARKNAENQTVYARAKMSVSLPHHFKGTHMSRFIEVLNDYHQKNLVGVDIHEMLKCMCSRLDAKSAYLKFDFKYFIEKQAPATGLSALMSYDCFFEGTLNEEKYKFNLGAKVPLTTLCPCSKEISEHGAHNQRALVKVKVSYSESEHIWLEDLITLTESSGSAEVYSLLKREDEKFVTEQAFNNPKFVEDVLRDIVIKLENHSAVDSFEVEIEAFESIHNHSAWAYQKREKGVGN
ncbi:GTP cyclohydrolase I [Candidatus Gastranaerophilus sp. (ex Termes propinquus)]|nr:GTP cyclohydrolase I [Candidatus Gastranaerophilus sp. (ex Termes propinquus)]